MDHAIYGPASQNLNRMMRLSFKPTAGSTMKDIKALSIDLTKNVFLILPHFTRHVILINYESIKEVHNGKADKKIYKRI
jgi:hypothetical protein